MGPRSARPGEAFTSARRYADVRPFRFAIHVTDLPQRGWRERIRFYERLGFDAVHVPDHFTMSQWDPIALSAAVGAVAERLAVAQTVLNAPLQQPRSLARAGATLAQIAPGGCEFGLGAGWMPADFEMTGAAAAP